MEPKDPTIKLLGKEEFLEKSKNLDAKKIAVEVLGWLIKNVENYIDNQESTFLIYFTYDILDESGLQELKKLQELYYAIGDSSDKEAVKEPDNQSSQVNQDVVEMLECLDAVVDTAKSEMEADKKRMVRLFDRLIYFYEMIGFSSLTGPIIKSFTGHVQFNHFIYEPICMPITVTQKTKKLVDGELVDSDVPDEIISEYTVPEGFSLEFELIKQMVED